MVDEAGLTRLIVIQRQASSLLQSLSGLVASFRFEGDDPTLVEAEALIEQAREILRDSEHAGVVPKWRSRRINYNHFAYVQDIRATLGSLNAALPVVIENLSQEREDLPSKISLLEARLSESESRSIAIKDDELRERCLDLLLRSGKADTAVRDDTVVLEDRVRRVAQLGNEFYGTGLIDRALNPTKGALEFDGTAQEREGLYQLFRGTVVSSRIQPRTELSPTTSQPERGKSSASLMYCCNCCRRPGRRKPPKRRRKLPLLDGGAGVLRRGADAAGADLQADGYAVDDERLGLHVRLKRAVGARSLTLPAPGVLVSDVVPKAGSLLADVTFGHD